MAGTFCWNAWSHPGRQASLLPSTQPGLRAPGLCAHRSEAGDQGFQRHVKMGETRRDGRNAASNGFFDVEKMIFLLPACTSRGARRPATRVILGFPHFSPLRSWQALRP